MRGIIASEEPHDRSIHQDTGRASESREPSTCRGRKKGLHYDRPFVYEQSELIRDNGTTFLNCRKTDSRHVPPVQSAPLSQRLELNLPCPFCVYRFSLPPQANNTGVTFPVPP